MFCMCLICIRFVYACIKPPIFCKIKIHEKRNNCLFLFLFLFLVDKRRRVNYLGILAKINKHKLKSDIYNSKIIYGCSEISISKKANTTKKKNEFPCKRIKD